MSCERPGAVRACEELSLVSFFDDTQMQLMQQGNGFNAEGVCMSQCACADTARSGAAALLSTSSIKSRLASGLASGALALYLEASSRITHSSCIVWSLEGQCDPMGHTLHHIVVQSVSVARQLQPAPNASQGEASHKFKAAVHDRLVRRIRSSFVCLAMYWSTRHHRNCSLEV